MTKRKKSPVKVPDLDVLGQITPDAAGLDIGSEEIYACVPADRDEEWCGPFQPSPLTSLRPAKGPIRCG